MYRPWLVFFHGRVVLRTGHRFSLDASVDTGDVRFLRHTYPNADAYSDSNADSYTNPYSDSNAHPGRPVT
jgi:hypothetical protein